MRDTLCMCTSSISCLFLALFTGAQKIAVHMGTSLTYLSFPTLLLIGPGNRASPCHPRHSFWLTLHLSCQPPAPLVRIMDEEGDDPPKVTKVKASRSQSRQASRKAPLKSISLVPKAPHPSSTGTAGAQRGGGVEGGEGGGLDVEKLKSILKGFGEYPAKYRSVTAFSLHDILNEPDVYLLISLLSHTPGRSSGVTYSNSLRTMWLTVPSWTKAPIPPLPTSTKPTPSRAGSYSGCCRGNHTPSCDHTPSCALISCKGTDSIV